VFSTAEARPENVLLTFQTVEHRRFCPNPTRPQLKRDTAVERFE
jgi:hypothetical protein